MCQYQEPLTLMGDPFQNRPVSAFPFPIWMRLPNSTCGPWLKSQRSVRGEVSQMECAPEVDSQQILTFYMGKNTPERKDYIMENLVVPVEEWRWRETPIPKSNSK